MHPYLVGGVVVMKLIRYFTTLVSAILLFEVALADRIHATPTKNHPHEDVLTPKKTINSNVPGVIRRQVSRQFVFSV
jgi:hypothetical protein